MTQQQGIQTPFGTIQPPLRRPPLDLGPMTGDKEYITARAESLVRTYSSLLGSDFQLQDWPNGETDCQSFVRAPLGDPEGYLVVEHELSHNLFGTDLVLTKAFREKAVERLLRRANIPMTHPDAEPYKGKLDALTHHLWNILEDQRCCWLWTQLYPGGGSLLSQRWYDISKYEMAESAKTNLLAYLARKAAGVATDDAPDHFKKCGKHVVRARNLVEGVDAAACLAITGRLLDDIADELLEEFKPDPPQPQTGGKAQQGQQSQGQQNQKAGSRPKGSGKGKKEKRQQKSKDKLQLLSSIVGDTDPSDKTGNSLGGRDLVEPAGKQKKPTARQLHQVQRLLTAKDDDEREDANGMSTLSSLLHAGATKMEDKLEAARTAMAMPKKSTAEQGEDLILGACRVAGAHGSFVEPTKPLPAPGPTAAKIRHRLERVRMRKKSRLHEEGDDIDIEAFIEASLNHELPEAKIFRDMKKETGLDLLILMDVSGSMVGGGLHITERALADVVFCCKTLKVEVQLWGFSDTLFFFKKIGSPKGVKGVRHGLTNMVQALDVAYEWAKKSKSTRAVILTTDGMPTSVRGRNSTGNAVDDLHNVLDEMRRDGIVLSVLAIDSYGMSDSYDRAFGKGNYGSIHALGDLSKALPQMVEVLVTAHLKRGR